MSPATPSLDRREWLRAALALACAPLLEAGARPGSVSELIPDSLAETARRVGARCRAAGVPADEGALLTGYAGTSATELAAHLAAKARADFEADRLVAVGPWWLSETEARVLALL